MNRNNRTCIHRSQATIIGKHIMINISAKTHAPAIPSRPIAKQCVLIKPRRMYRWNRLSHDSRQFLRTMKMDVTFSFQPFTSRNPRVRLIDFTLSSCMEDNSLLVQDGLYLSLLQATRPKQLGLIRFDWPKTS